MNDLMNVVKPLNKSNENRKKFQCLQCFEYFRFHRHYDKHVEGHKRNNCEHCGKLFTVRKQLAVHLYEEHQLQLKDLKYSCQFCDKRFVKKISLHQHLQLHANGKKVCLHCGAFFSEMNEFLKHQDKHKYEKPWKCEKCDEKFSRRQQYQMHIQAHDNYACITCMKSFSAQSQLAEHKKLGHEVKEFAVNHVCDKCNRSFPHHRALVLHRRVHQGNTSFECFECNKNFSSKRSYSKHLSTAIHRGCKKSLKNKLENDIIYICDTCGKKFKDKHSLRLHVTRIHYPEEPTKCDYCDYKSSSKANLKRHMEFHTEDRKFICECCGASFHMLCTLKEHNLYVHSEERNFPCPKCDKSFKRKCGLNRHMQDHSELRPYVCHCGQSYKRMSHLKRHKEASHGLVSQPNKLCRLRLNELGVLVPTVDKHATKFRKKTELTLENRKGKINEDTPYKELNLSPVLGIEEVRKSNNEKDMSSFQCDSQKKVSKGLYTECKEIRKKEAAIEAISNAGLANDKNTVEGNQSVEVSNTSLLQLGTPQMCSFQEVNIDLSKFKNLESIPTTISPESQVSLNVGYLLEDVGHNQQNCYRNIGVYLDNNVISYPSSSQVVDIIQEPNENLPLVNFVQIVSPGNMPSEETAVLLCLSSVSNPVLNESFEYSSE